MSTAFSCYFRALLGQPDVDSVVTAIAILRESDDTLGFWMSIQAVALTMGYAGQPEGFVKAADELIKVGETFDDPFWAAAGKNWRSLAAILNEDIDTARDLLPEAMEIYEERNDPPLR